MSDPSQPQPNDIEAALEAEINEALGDMSVEDMMDLADRPHRPGRSGPSRESRTGTIASIHGDDVFVEFGPKAQGVCPLGQFKEAAPEVGQAMEFVIERMDEADGLLILSRDGAVQKAAWESLEVGLVIEARCSGMNKGGLEMEVANHRAFMPAGQVDLRHIEDLGIFVGEKLPCEIIELDRQRGRIILSRKSLLLVEQEKARKELMETLEVGNRCPAIITSIKPFGAFADIGGMDGLIHISDLSYERVKTPEDVVKVGDTVEVQILKIDDSQTPPRVGLGMKQCLSDPYESSAGELEVGSTASGRVTKITQFGAFVELSPGVEGLVHISELSHERVNRVNQVVREDEVVQVKILEIDPARRRISLSIKALSQKAAEEAERGEDPQMRKLRAQLSKKFGELKGGIG